MEAAAGLGPFQRVHRRWWGQDLLAAFNDLQLDPIAGDLNAQQH
jgi:hypothetical protein